MKAAVYYETGSPEVFRYETVPDPAVDDSAVLVKVEAISIEGGDTLSRAGGDLGSPPHIVGYQCAGTIVETGSAVSDLAVGDRVVTVGLDGSHAELRAAPASFCWKVPDGLDIELAACVPVAMGTAHDCCHEFGGLQAGETVLVQAGASAVGIAAIQIATAVGARVLATASSDDRLARLEPHGLRPGDGINYTTHEFVSEVRARTEGRGVDLAIDTVGSTLQGSLASLAYRGRCVSVGDAGRDSTLVDTSVMRPNNLTLRGYFLGIELFMAPRAHAMIAGLIDDVAAGRLEVVIDRRYPLAEAADAHAYIESRQAFGRVVLVP